MDSHFLNCQIEKLNTQVENKIRLSYRRKPVELELAEDVSVSFDNED